MPVIVYKTMTIELFYAQTRRILCEHCQQPFCYIVGDVQSAQTTGVPLVSSDDGMRDSALQQAIHGLRKVAKKPRVGEGKCPHCHCFQGWMVTSSHKNNMGCMGIIGLIVFAGIPLALNYVVGWTNNHLLVGLIGGAMGLMLGMMLGKLIATTRGPHPELEDNRVKTDEEFQQFVLECHEQEYDASLLWWIMQGNEPGEEQATIGLGIEDTTGTPMYPVELTTDHVLAQV